VTRPSILAFLAVRDEAGYLPRTLAHLAREGVAAVVLDNGSQPAARRQLEQLREAGLARAVLDLPWTGHFDLVAQLEAKARLVAACDADWVMHLDADELPHSGREGETLAAAIARADAAGCNAANFLEFVFLPLEDAGDAADGGGFFPFRHYYHFAPARHWRMIAWRRDAGLSNLGSGGHLLHGDGPRLVPEDFVLRHYLFLSQQHAREKYARRRFSPAELARGWHGNRIDIPPARMQFPPAAKLHRLERIEQHALDASRPHRRHYWQWDDAPA
jgi:hypothetical protein